MRIQERTKPEGIRITVIGSVVNTLLSTAKIAIGLWYGSQVMVADGFHSLSDLATDVVVYVGLVLGARPRDEDHPYGHRRIESLAEALTGLALVLFAGLMVWSSLRVLLGEGEAVTPAWPVLAAAVVSIVSKEWLYRVTVREGRRIASGAVIANAWHHRSDAMSSIGALVALVLARLHPSLRIMDPLGGLAIALIVGWVGLKVAWNAVRHIVDTAPDPEVLEQARRVALKHPGVFGLHRLRARYLGSQIIMDLHIQVDPGLSVGEGHDIASEVEYGIARELGNVYDITVHVEPGQEERKGILDGSR